MKVNVLIPMAGEGSRFRREGFHRPKPFIDVAGVPMIEWVFDNLSSCVGNIQLNFIVVIRKSHDERYHIAEQLRKVRPMIKVVYAEALTEGAACTTLLAREQIDNDTPLLIVNSDQFVEWKAEEFWAQMLEEFRSGKDGNILCFHLPKELNDTKWSYASVDDEGHVTDVKEKVVISSNATVGVYYWRRGSEYVRCANEMIRKNIRVKGEFYVAPVYNEGVSQGMKFTLSFCKKMYGLGIPADLNHFLANYVRPRRMQARELSVDGDVLETYNPPVLIAHRGNVNGVNRDRENHPSYIEEALMANFHVEVDVWYMPDTDEWWLGHDEPQYRAEYKMFQNSCLWVHCKNMQALLVLSQDPQVHCFFHDVDACTLTSHNIIWTYPNQPLDGRERAVAVMYDDPVELVRNRVPLYGICCDNPMELRSLMSSAHRESHIATLDGDDNPTVRNLKAVVFDLDGVLVSSKDIHYDALNEALRSVGDEYVITREEHESLYDGLSTKQKLRMLEVNKGLQREHHVAVFLEKQENTQRMFRDMVRPDDEIKNTLRCIKNLGFPIGVASNCIRSSVEALLDAIGVMDEVDVYLSNEDVEHPKPAGDIYVRAARAFGCRPDECLVFEDNVKGFEACTRAGGRLVRVTDPSVVRVPYILDNMRRLDYAGPDLVVAMPLARQSQYFFCGGPTAASQTMPLVVADVLSKSVLKWMCENIATTKLNVHFVVLLQEHDDVNYHLERMVVHATNFAPTTVIKLGRQEQGAVCTLLRAKHLFNTDVPLLVHDGGHIVDWGGGRGVDDFFNTFMNEDADGALLVHRDMNPRWSYAKLVANTNRVQLVREKQVISDHACTGMYGFKHGSDFVHAAERLIAKRDTFRGRYYVSQLYNELIADNKNVVAFDVPKSYSVRELNEIHEFTLYASRLNVVVVLESIYAEMIERNTKCVSDAGTLTGDPLLSELVDDRRCRAVYTLCTDDNWKPSGVWNAMIEELQTLLPDQVMYDVLSNAKPPAVLSGHLHMTFMQLVKFGSVNSYVVPNDFYDTVGAFLSNVMVPYEVHFHSLVLTKGSILVLGFPSVEVNSIREKLRNEMSRLGTPLLEPYKNDIVHMTLVRFAAPLSAEKVKQLTAFTQRFRQFDLGILNVKNVSIGDASWKMQPQELALHSDTTFELNLV